MEPINLNTINTTLGAAKITARLTLLGYKPSRANYAPISSNALTVEVIIRQILTFACYKLKTLELV